METGVTPARGLQTGFKRATAGLGERLDLSRMSRDELIPAGLTILFFVVLFGQPFLGLASDWWNLPEAGHGLLLAPVAVWLAWRSGIREGAEPNRALGLSMLVIAVAIRCAAGLAAEMFSMRASMIMALGGLTVYHFGFRQLLHWWLPFVLACLAIPLPELVTQALALPLQFRASRMGAALLHMRHVPVVLTGNVIRLPGHELFVTEACSGLRSLTALLSVGVLMGAMLLETLAGRVILLAFAIPIAIVVNGIRVFMTGFLVFFVSPEFGTGFMHMTEGWLLFLVSLSSLALFAWLVSMVERRVRGGRQTPVVHNA